MKMLVNEQDLVYEGQLHIEQERVDVTPWHHIDPDPHWSYVDSAGHFHAFSLSEEGNLPTLDREQVEHEHFDGDDGAWTSVEVTWKCRICQAPVNPEWVTRHTTHREYAPGRLSWRAEIRAVGPACTTLQELDGTLVSVRVEVEGEESFGIGLLKTLGMAGGDRNHIRWFGCVYGNGPLGQRKVTR